MNEDKTTSKGNRMTSKNKLTDNQKAKLQEASKAHTNLVRATAKRISSIKDAVDAGVPMATVAKEIGMTRSSIWHILDRAAKKKEGK